MQEMMEGLKVTAFGEWNIYGHEKLQAHEFVRARFFVGDGEDLFEVLASPVYDKHQPRRSSVRSGGVERDEGRTTKKKKKKKMYYYEERIDVRKAKAVDEDLYRIPNSELLFHQIPKNKKSLLIWKFWAGCLCLGCIA